MQKSSPIDRPDRAVAGVVSIRSAVDGRQYSSTITSVSRKPNFFYVYIFSARDLHGNTSSFASKSVSAKESFPLLLAHMCRSTSNAYLLLIIPER